MRSGSPTPLLHAQVGVLAGGAVGAAACGPAGALVGERLCRSLNRVQGHSAPSKLFEGAAVGAAATSGPPPGPPVVVAACLQPMTERNLRREHRAFKRESVSQISGGTEGQGRGFRGLRKRPKLADSLLFFRSAERISEPRAKGKASGRGPRRWPCRCLPWQCQPSASRRRASSRRVG